MIVNNSLRAIVLSILIQLHDVIYICFLTFIPKAIIYYVQISMLNECCIS